MGSGGTELEVAEAKQGAEGAPVAEAPVAEIPAEAAETAAEAPQDPVQAFAASVASAAEELRRQQITLESLLRPLRAGDARRGLEVAVTAAGAFAFAVDVPALLTRAQEVCQAEQERRRERLSAELKAACQRAGLVMKVVAREPAVELRIAPITVRLDRDRNQAEVLYGQERLEYCPASPEGILEARARALRLLEGDRAWEAAGFHALLRRAWRYALDRGAFC